MATDRARIVTYITPESDEKIEVVMKKFGLTKSKSASLAIQLGLDALLIAINPDWKTYFETTLKNYEEKTE